MNSGGKTPTGAGPAPSSNDEYAFYQNLLGVWPLEGVTPESVAPFSDRLEGYMLKAAREASSITNPLFNPLNVSQTSGMARIMSRKFIVSVVGLVRWRK